MDGFLSELETYAESVMEDQWRTFFRVAFSNGKHVRPLLIRDICHASRMDPTPFIPAAVAVELIHAGSLIHDDLVDGDESRRGAPSFSSQFGMKQGILFGDYLMAKALGLLSTNYESPPLLAKTASVLELMIQSQLMESAGGVKDLDSYWRYIHGKTAVLFELCAEIPHILGDKENEQMVPFASTYGMAFQIADDLSEEEWEGEPNILHFMSREDATRLFHEKVDVLRRMNFIPVENLSFMIPIKAQLP